MIVSTAWGQQAVDSLPAINGLPDPFLMNDGTRVTSPEQWPARRAEIREMILRFEYGTVAPASPVKLVEKGAWRTTADGKNTLRVDRVATGPNGSIEFAVHFSFPEDTSTPRPVILQVNLGFPIPEVNERGYIFACYNHTQFDPDTQGTDMVGPAQTAYPDETWGSLGTWAWGASRVLDYLLTLPEVDPQRVVITGHSRRGKTALLAGVLDERFAIVAPNGSGCGGTGSFRILGEKCEDIAAITDPKRFYSWFHKDFGQFGGKEDRLPFDQHFMRALVAPRAMFDTNARGDMWANPKGTQAMYFASQPVFDFLGVPENNGIHFRDGKHEHNEEDFIALLNFADWKFGRSKERPKDVLNTDDYRPELGWKAPATTK